MSIASGFTKMKNYILTSSGYKLLSRWTSSQTVHMGDGTDDTDTVEYRFGAIKGITSSLATDNDEYALSASAGKNLQDQCTQLNQSLTKLNNKDLKALNSNYAAYYYKNGNTVYIVADFANKTVPQNGVTLGTLPIGYRPYVEVYGRNGFDNQNGEMMVNRSGVVKLQSASGSFNYGHFSCCFPCTDTL